MNKGIIAAVTVAIIGVAVTGNNGSRKGKFK